MARQNLCVGIDIGASAIKLCQLKKTGRSYTMERYGSVPLPPDTLVDGTIMNSALLVEALQQLVTTCKLKHRQVALAISGHAVIIKKIALPQMTREELDSSVNWEAEQFIPFNINDVYMDIQIVGPSAAQQGQMDVLLVAAKKDFVNEYTSVIMEAGLEPVVCDVDAFALETLYEATYEPPKDSSVALVHVGATKTHVNIVRHGTSAFTRDLTVGGNAFTEEIQKALGLSQEDAERIKIAQSPLPPGAVTGLQSVATTITADIMRSIDFYTSTSAESAPTQLYLSGGSAALPVLMQVIEAHVGMPVSHFDLFRTISAGNVNKELLHSSGSSAAVAMGLALRYPGDG
jgi:type IV pilus assembly protein PilM